MAAYAAAVSLMHIIDLIENHPYPPISFDKQQLHSLTQLVTFLQEFLEGYVSPFSYSDEADPLEMRIADAVYAAEDVIESYIVDNIHHAAGITHDDGDDDDDDDENSESDDDDDDEEEEDYSSHDDDDDSDDDYGKHDDDDDIMESYIVDNIQLAAAAAHDEDEQIRYINFYEGLQKVIEVMDLIKKEAMAIVKHKGGLEAELPRNVSVDAAFKSGSTVSKSAMVGFEDELLQLKERLVRGDSNRQIIPIVGMGGIGKTTLALNVFADKLIKEHFDICVWATISQDYNIEQTLSEVLSSLGRGNSGVKGLGEDLHKHLFGRMYLVVLDDMWSIEAWDKMRFFFPDCGNGSRVIVTTRMSNLAAHLTNSSNSLCMSFLNEVDSWTLFSQTVFGDEDTFLDLQPQLREIGKKIVGKCKGLPLSIAVIGGLLAKSERTQGYWEYIEENLSSIVNLENEEYCLRVLKLSYNHLPAYLKSCFLYMGMFDEDSVIEVSKIIHLWVSEGFLKPKKGKKNLETVAREYFQELVDRNLVLAADDLKLSEYLFESKCELGSVVHDIRLCKMHDLVRDLSLREAQKQRFYYIYSKERNHPSNHPHSHRRIVIPEQTGGTTHVPKIMLESSSNPRSYVSNDDYAQLFPDFRLLRTLYSHSGNYFNHHVYSQKEVFGLVNARLLSVPIEHEKLNNVLGSSISRLWSLHTLILHSEGYFKGPTEFWNMHQLKHVEFIRLDLRLPPPPPPNNGNNIVILENLHTLVGVKDLYLNEDVVRRLPNLRILDVHYWIKLVSREADGLSYLQRLSKLESFGCSIYEGSGENLERICFPQSLKHILLMDSYKSNQKIELEGFLQKLGWLPFLEEVVIQYGFFKSGGWETTEDQFPSLKILELANCRGLRKWTVSEGSSHFPLLQKLILVRLGELEEIPSEIGEIATLKSIKVSLCSKSAVLSAKRIVEEQEELYGEEELSFRVLVIGYEDMFPAGLATPNFQVKLL